MRMEKETGEERVCERKTLFLEGVDFISLVSVRKVKEKLSSFKEQFSSVKISPLRRV